MSLDELANYIIKRLKARRITVHRLDSISTSSIYIKFDYGVANSLRIGDHHGRPKYDYRFNLLTNIQERFEDDGGKYVKHYYPESEVDRLIEDIIVHRNSRMARYGTTRYQKAVTRNYKATEHEKGFWQRATKV